MVALIVVQHPRFVESPDPVTASLTQEGLTQAHQIADMLARRSRTRRPPLVLHCCSTRSHQVAMAVATRFGTIPSSAHWLTHGPSEIETLTGPTQYRQARVIVACAHRPCVQAMLTLSGQNSAATGVPFGSVFRFELNPNRNSLAFIRRIA